MVLKVQQFRCTKVLYTWQEISTSYCNVIRSSHLFYQNILKKICYMFYFLRGHLLTFKIFWSGFQVLICFSKPKDNVLFFLFVFHRAKFNFIPWTLVSNLSQLKKVNFLTLLKIHMKIELGSGFIKTSAECSDFVPVFLHIDQVQYKLCCK